MLSAIRRPAARAAAVVLTASALLGVAAPAFADTAAPAASASAVALPSASPATTTTATPATHGASATASSSPTTAPIAPKKSNTTARVIGFVALLIAGVGGGMFLSWIRSRRGTRS